MNKETKSRTVKLEQDRLQSALDSINAFVVIENEDFSIQFENKALRQAFGGKVGQKCYKSYIGRDEPCEICPVKEILHRGKSEFIYHTEAGGRIFESRAAKLQNPDGSLSIIEILTDITDNINATNELKATNLELKEKEKALQNSQNELTSKISTLERINKIMLEREIEMIRLKEEVNQLLVEQGKDKKYKIAEKTNRG